MPVSASFRLGDESAIEFILEIQGLFKKIVEIAKT